MTEQKHESDLTPKEKRQLEWQKVKQMSAGKRLEYFWDYYKFVLVIAAGVIALICGGVEIYHNSQNVILLTVDIVNAAQGADGVADEFLTSLGEEAGKDDSINVDTGLLSSDEEGSLDYTSNTKLVTLIAAGGVDVMICNKGLYERFSSQDAFLDLSTILPQEDQENYSEWLQKDALCVSKNVINQKYDLVTDDEVYITVVGSTKKQEMAVKFIEYLLNQ